MKGDPFRCIMNKQNEREGISSVVNYENRKQVLQSKLRVAGIDGMLVTQNVDIYYLTGSMQSGFVFVPKVGEALYFVRRSVVRAQEESHLNVEELGSMRTFGARLTELYPDIFGKAESIVLATEFDVLPVAVFQRFQSVIPNVRWTDGSQAIRETRMIKSPYEIGKIREAAHVVDLALEKAIAHVKLGMAENELLAMIELTFRLNGHLGLMRMRGYNQEIITGMVGSGSAAATPSYFDGPAGGLGLSPASPQSASRKAIGINEPILVDIGCCIEGYVIDQTRTLVFGQLDAELTRAYEVAEQILRTTESSLKSGTVCETLYLQALHIAHEAGLSDHFMGFGADQVKFLGHGIGLEIDEWPVLAKGFTYPLQAGMVIAIEPKFTFPNRGVVGIENTYLITETGYEKLTTSQEGIIRVTSIDQSIV